MKVKEIKVEFGVSLATGDKSWIKANAGMTVELDSPNDKTDDAFEGAWNRVTKEVGDQVKNFDVVIVKKDDK